MAKTKNRFEKFKDYCEDQGFTPTEEQQEAALALLGSPEFEALMPAGSGKSMLYKHLAEFIHKGDL